MNKVHGNHHLDEAKGNAREASGQVGGNTGVEPEETIQNKRGKVKAAYGGPETRHQENSRKPLPEKQADEIPIAPSGITSVLQSPLVDQCAAPFSLQRRLAEIYPELARQQGSDPSILTAKQSAREPHD